MDLLKQAHQDRHRLIGEQSTHAIGQRIQHGLGSAQSLKAVSVCGEIGRFEVLWLVGAGRNGEGIGNGDGMSFADRPNFVLKHRGLDHVAHGVSGQVEQRTSTLALVDRAASQLVEPGVVGRPRAQRIAEVSCPARRCPPGQG